MSAAKLYVVPASHPCATVMKALELKGVPYERVDLVPVFHRAAQKLRFGGAGTVPGIVFEGGRKVLGSREILRDLESTRPDPPLYPLDAAARAKVEEAETWGDEVLQPLVRRVIWLALTNDKSAQLSYMEGAKLVPPTPRPVAKLSAGMVAFLERRMNDCSPEAVAKDMTALPGHLDRIEAWISDGTLGTDPPNAADLQIAASLRLLLTIEDVARVIDGRPAGEYTRGLFPSFPGHIPAGALPAAG